MEIKEVVHEVEFKFLDISFLGFSLFEINPGKEEIVE